MSHEVLPQLVGILVGGILAQWVAWRIRLPSILLLLGTGLLAGPLTGLLHPDRLLGDLMLPMVSLSVALILYEGGLSLKIRELDQIGRVFVRLTTVGVLISWAIGTVAAHLLLDFGWPVATLLGATLVVTGPTVIIPILRHLRLRGKVGALLKWEGIIIDPVGAALAVLAFTVVQAGWSGEGFGEAARDLGVTVIAGVLVGAAAAGVLVVALVRFWIPDWLHNPVSLMLMLAAFTTADMAQDEAGLLAVTVMGIVLANQKWVSIRHVVAFKETLSILLISGLFILLSARITPADLRGLGGEAFAFVAVMVVIARPAAVLASTWGSPLTWRERCFLCLMAPRGIVAAAIASVFALSLVAIGHPRAVEMVPVTFLLVFVTVSFYGFLAGPLARRLGLIEVNPQGILFVGAQPWVRALAEALHDEHIAVVLVDTDWENVRRARMAGLPCRYGNALAEATREEIDYGGLGRMLAVTSNDAVNSLACLRYAEDFGREGVYQLPFHAAKGARHEVTDEFHGRLLFGDDLTFAVLAEQAGRTPQVKKTKLSREFDWGAFRREHGDTVLPLVVLQADGTLRVRTTTGFTDPKPGDTILSFVRHGSTAGTAAAAATGRGENAAGAALPEGSVTWPTAQRNLMACSGRVNACSKPSGAARPSCIALSHVRWLATSIKRTAATFAPVRRARVFQHRPAA